ncbi:coiled-coil domain-containing protein 183-like [Rhynochetos jubatus]
MTGRNELSIAAVWGAQKPSAVALAGKTEEVAELLAVPRCLGLPGLLRGPAASLGERCCLCVSLPVPRLWPSSKPVEMEALAPQSCLCLGPLAGPKQCRRSPPASTLLEQQNSSGDLEQLIRELTEEAAVLEKTLRELELKRDELQFHQPPNTTRMLEEELRANLKREEARLEQMQAQTRRNKESLLDFESGVDHLFARLHGISVPGQDSIKAGSVEEKLQQCGQKLRYLMQRVADLPPSKRSLDDDNEIFVKVRSLLESKTAEDTGSQAQGRRCQQGHIPQGCTVAFSSVDSCAPIF